MVQFQLFGFPVRVDFTFFLLALFLGLSRLDNPPLMFIWLGVVFFSVLVHELGHALVARSYGIQPGIHLYSFGGLTFWQHGPRLSHHQHIWLSFAGPLAGFIVAGLIYALSLLLPSGGVPILVQVLVRDMLWVNLGWGVLNLLPIMPMDGGHIMRSTVHLLTGNHDMRIPVAISMTFCGLIMLYLIVEQISVYMILLCAWFMYHNYQLLQADRQY